MKKYAYKYHSLFCFQPFIYTGDGHCVSSSDFVQPPSMSLAESLPLPEPSLFIPKLSKRGKKRKKPAAVGHVAHLSSTQCPIQL